MVKNKLLIIKTKMNVKYIYGIIIVVLAMCVSCEDNRLDGMVEDQIYLLNHDFFNVDVFNFGEFTSNVVVCKGGIGQSSAEVELLVDQTLISRHNNNFGTSYQMLPSNCYTLSATKLLFETKDVRQVVTVTYNTKAIGDLPDRDSYIIPLQMKVGEGIDFDQDKQVLLIRPIYIEPVIFFPKFSTPSEMAVSATTDTSSYSFEVGINYRNLIEPFVWDINFEIVPDQSILDEYNASSEKNLQMAPPESYSLNREHWNIAKGKTVKDVPVQFYRKKLIDQSGNYLFGDYALPIKISSVSNWYIDDQRDNMIMIMQFRPSQFDASKWKVIDWNSDITMDDQHADVNKKPDGMLTGTGWRSKWETPLPDLPYYFVIDMLESRTITHINIVFPSDEPSRGNVRAGIFEISNDNESWTKIADWTRGTDNAPRMHRVPIASENQIKARYLKFVINTAISYVTGNATTGGSARMDVQQLEIIGYD